ncbi:MAG: DUF1566 domain-containing protein [Gammaproteobacteria bacterium]|nr:DUF1566 domain-containing protein [Gammaproteobacteria bacterium]
MDKLIGCATAVVLACGVTVAEASLIDRGNGLIYDDVLDITWLQDARLAASATFGTPGIRVDDAGNPGAMTWDTAFKWIEAMNHAGYKGFNNWRMPTVTPVNGSYFQYDVSYDGSTDKGFNNTSTSNELSHLYYVGLGNLGLCSTDNPVGSDSDSCNQSVGDTWGLQNTGPFDNLIAGRYWTSVHDTRPDQQRAFDLDATFGQMGTGATNGYKFVWAVLDGDVAAVPVPAAAWLLGSGLVALWGVGRSRRHTS